MLIPLRPLSRFCLALSGVFVLLVTGCGEQPQIKTYPIAKSARNLGPEPSEPGESRIEPARMLAAMISRGEKTWFFKVVGPPEEVAKQADRFRKLLATVEFSKPDAPAWELPEDWTQERGKPGSLRFATIKIPGSLEMTVISLGGTQSVLKNVNRWRNQVLLAPISQAEIAKETEKLATKDDEAIFVDLLGRQEVGGGGGPMAGRAPFLEAMQKRQEEARKAAARQQAPPPPPKYDLPKGWKQVPTVPKPFSTVIETVEVTDGEEKSACHHQPDGANA